MIKSLGLKFDYLPIERKCDELHPKRTAKVLLNNTEIGFIGALHPKYAKDNDLNDTYVAEIRLKEILEYEKPITKYSQISKVPNVERDIAIVLDKEVLAGDVINTILKVD